MEIENKEHGLTDRAAEDYILVRKAVDTNDQQAFSELMGRYRNSIYHMMLKMVNNREDADDLTIEAFGKAFKKLGAYTPSYAFSTWLFRIAINNCIDHIRKKRLKTLSIDEPISENGKEHFAGNIKSPALDPEASFIRGQKVSLIRKVMGRLSIKYRLMIEMRYFEDMTYEEISNELEIPLGTVKAQLFRAKQLLLKHLQTTESQAYLDYSEKKK